jgi:hypothetical protein
MCAEMLEHGAQEHGPDLLPLAKDLHAPFLDGHVVAAAVNEAFVG